MWAFNDKEFAIGRNLIDYLKENKADITARLSFMRIKEEKAASKNARMVCMTGGWIRKRDDLQKEIAAKGDVAIDSVSKDCNILILDDINSTSSKAIKAKKLGVKLMSYQEYFA